MRRARGPPSPHLQCEIALRRIKLPGGTFSPSKWDREHVPTSGAPWGSDFRGPRHRRAPRPAGFHAQGLSPLGEGDSISRGVNGPVFQGLMLDDGAAEGTGDLGPRRTCQMMNKTRYPQAPSASFFGCLHPIRKTTTGKERMTKTALIPLKPSGNSALEGRRCGLGFGCGPDSEPLRA